MASISFIVPVLPGKEQADLDWMEALNGARREEYRTAWKDAGLVRHAVWQQQTPDGALDIVYLEADDIPAAMEQISSSDEPFHQWFRRRVLEVHGLDLTEHSPPDTTPVHDTSF
jgi:hypothetical protein